MQKYQQTMRFEDRATVQSVEEKDGFLLLRLNETIFYPGGGGQPHDVGRMTGDGFEADVVEVSKDNLGILHKAKPVHGSIKPGDQVTMHVDRERRLRLARMHTGEHVLFQSIQRIVPDAVIEKVDLDPTESSLFINAKSMTWEQMFEAEARANEIIREDRDVVCHEISKHDAQSMERLRIKVDRIKDETVRVIEVKDYDWSACAGTHVERTGEIGNILVTKFSVMKGKWEVRFKTDVMHDLYMLSQVARKCASILQTDMPAMPEMIQKLMSDNESLKDRFRQVSARLLDMHDTKDVGRAKLITSVVEEVEKKQLVDKSNSLISDNTVVCFLSKAEGRYTVILNTSPALAIDAPAMLSAALEKFGGKGGGRGSFAMGSFTADTPDAFLKEIEDRLLEKLR